MSWIIPIWSIAAGVCLCLAALHFLVWLRSRASLVNLIFSLAAMAGCAIALQEMVLMHAQTPVEYGELLRWMHVSVAVIIIAIVWIVRLHLRAGRVWLAWLVSGLRIVVLLANLLTSPNATFREITGLRSVPWLGEVVSIPVGEPSPWRILIHVSSVLLLFYVLDAGVTAWRRGDRRRAVFLSGPVAGAILLSVLFSQLMVWKVVPGPLIGLVFLLIVMAMAIELSMDLIRARQNALDLQKSEERLSLAASAAELGLWEWDVARDEIWVTDVGRKRVGAGDSERIDFNRFLQSLHPDDREAMRQAVDQALRGNGEFRVEYRFLRASGETRWMSAQGRVERDSDNKPLCVRGVSIDITERKHAEAEAHRQQADLAHMSRVSSMGQLSGSLAHELNQPLGIILSNAQAGEELLGQAQPDLTELKDILGDIVAADRRAGEVIQRMRAMLKRGEMARQPLQLNDVLQEVLGFLRADLIRKRVAVRSELAPELPAVLGDQVQLQQVLLNLILNAVDAMAGNQPGTCHLDLTTSRHQDRVRVTVRDEGVGLPADFERLFQPYTTTKPHGLGMGLPICRSILEAHGGRLWAEPHPERGALFHFELPVMNPQEKV